MKKNIDVKNLVNNAKILGLSIASVLVMAACKTYITTVVAVYDNNKILVKDESNDERLIDCSKKTNNNQQLLQDIPYFVAGDQLQIKQKNPFYNYNYDGRRVFGDDSNIKYNADTIQIRKDREIIANVKAKSQQTR